MPGPSLHRQLILSDPIRSYNEDNGGVTNGAAWVLDGATGVTDETHTGASSDGQWYVEQFDRYLRENVSDRSRSLTEHVVEGITEIRNQFTQFARLEEIDSAGEPSATGAIVRWHGDTLEYYVLCDSTFLMVKGGEVVDHISDTRIAEIEDEVRGAARGWKREGLDLEEAREQILPLLRESRRNKNSSGSYWVLSFDPEAAREALTGRHRLTSEIDIYLFTDGFGRLVDVYDEYPDWEAAMIDIRRNGVEAALDRIRAIERDDPEGDDYFRLKPSDDATVVELRFGSR